MSTRAALLFVTVGFGLACGGLPLDPSALAPAEPGELAEVEPEVLPEPHELFATLDADEEPPASPPRCPPGSTQVRYPRGGAMEIYCASASGRREGTWTRWKGDRLVEARAYAEGSQHGVATRWEAGRKVEEAWWVGGVQQGDYAAWSPEGVLLVRGAYVDGERHGRFLELGLGEAFGGACYDAGAEVWRTDDPEAFVGDPCAADDDREGEVAALSR